MNDKTAVITGATKGLGRALSLVFAENGYDIIGLYRRDEVAAKSLETEFRKKSLRGFFIKQDIIEDDFSRFEEIIESAKSNRLTFIANACSRFTPKPLHLVDWQEISALLEVNLKGTFQVFKRLLPSMIKTRDGVVIGILTAALHATPLPPKGFSAYIAAKSALEGWLKGVAAEYAARGVRVFTVSPDLMKTALTDNWSEHLKSSTHKGGRVICDPMEVAAQIFNLTVNPETSAMGENYLLDGTISQSLNADS
jgi:NAD(P)-dependent dehydrogenase (short-subunit alcohol dehydrogenase family)